MDVRQRAQAWGFVLAALTLLAAVLVWHQRRAPLPPVEQSGDLVGVARQCQYVDTGHGLLPDHTCTPGELRADLQGKTDAEIAAIVCEPGWSARNRPGTNVTGPLKRDVMREYGVGDQPPRDYEGDHLIPNKLGGATSRRNLWPQPASPAPGYHEKDATEAFLIHAVCVDHSMPLRQAATAMATDWTTLLENARQAAAAGVDLDLEPEGSP